MLVVIKMATLHARAARLDLQLVQELCLFVLQDEERMVHNSIFPFIIMVMLDGQQRNELQRASITSLDLNIIATSTDHMIQGDSQAMRAVMLVFPLSENSTRSFSVKCEVQYLDTIYPYEKILTSGNL